VFGALYTIRSHRSVCAVSAWKRRHVTASVRVPGSHTPAPPYTRYPHDPALPSHSPAYCEITNGLVDRSLSLFHVVRLLNNTFGHSHSALGQTHC